MAGMISIALAIWAAAHADWQDDLQNYYLTENPAARQKLESRILADPACTAETLADAIKVLRLWEEQAPGVHDMELRVGRSADATKEVVVSIPADYDPAKTWPLIITLHGQGQSAASMMQMTRAMLGTTVNDHIIVAPQGLGPLGFTEPGDVVDQPRQLLISTRKKFRIDSDRVFLMGYSIGGHNTWMAAIMHADCLAGIMPLATPLQVIGNDLLYEVLAPNLRNLDTLFVWGAQDNLGQDGKPHPLGGNAAMARKLAEAMREACGKRFVGIELPDAHHGNVRPPADEVRRWLACRRETWPRRVHHQFRLAEQSDAGWIKAESLIGKPLADGMSTVRVKPGEDPQESQKKKMTMQLGLVGGLIDTPTSRNHPAINIRTFKARGVTILLSESMLDLKRGALVRRNQTVVHNGGFTPDRRVMLRETAATWDFARIPQVRMVIPNSGKKVTFGYSDRAK